jgi:hypothetical protein
MFRAHLEKTYLEKSNNGHQSFARIPETQISALTSMLCGVNAPQRKEAEAFIHRIFDEVHGANVKHFMPQMLCLKDSHQQLLAVSGMRSAEQEVLFLERYLNAPVEEVIASHAKTEVKRNQVVEIGNLAVERPSYTRILMAALSAHLYSTDTEWIVFSALPVVRNAVAKTNHEMFVLADATLDKIAPEDRADWGSYYDHQPQVIAVRLNKRAQVAH